MSTDSEGVAASQEFTDADDAFQKATRAAETAADKTAATATASTEQATTTTAQPDTDTAKLKAELEAANARLSTLQGKYNAEVPSLHAENKRLKEEREALEKAKQQPAKVDTAVEDPDILAFDTEAPTVAKAVRKLVGRLVQESVGDTTRKVDEKVDQVAARVEEDRKARDAKALDDSMNTHFKTINDAHADWQTVVGSPKFKSYVEAMPSWQRNGAQRVLEAGQAGEVIDLIADFKKANPNPKDTKITDSEVVTSRDTPIGINQGAVKTDDSFDSGFDAAIRANNPRS